MYLQGDIEKKHLDLWFRLSRKHILYSWLRGQEKNLYTKMVMAEYDKLSQLIVFAS